MATRHLVTAVILLLGETGCETRAEPRRITVEANAIPADSEAAGRLVDSLGPLAPTNSGAATLLFRAMAHRNQAVGSTAAWWLSRAGPSMVPPLIATLSDPNPTVKTRAAYTLGEIGPKAKSALSQLATVLGGPDDSAAGMASWAIDKIAGNNPGRAIVLLQTLRYGPSLDRFEALTAIRGLGAGGLPFVSILIRTLSDPDPALVRAAGNALIQIGPLVRPAVEAAASRGNSRAQAEARRVLRALARAF